MTPKEKAKNLLLTFSECGEDKALSLESARKCALLCVDEIMKTKPLEKDYDDHGHLGREIWYNDMTDYWHHVKHEIYLIL